MREAFGIILAGGRARRLGGVDKGLIAVAGEPILARLARPGLAPKCRPRAERQRRSRAVRGHWSSRDRRRHRGLRGTTRRRARRHGLCRREFSGYSPDRYRSRRHAVYSARSRGAAGTGGRASRRQLAAARSGDRAHHAVAPWPGRRGARCGGRWWRKTCEGFRIRREV